jgi:hypothetical protein
MASALIGLGGTAISAYLGYKGSKKAADTQVQAQGQAIQNQKDALAQGQKTVADATGTANDILSRSAQTQIGMYDPYVKAGQGSLTSLTDLASAGGALDQKFSFNPTDLQNDPGYAFALKQGKDAIAQAAAAKGGLFSAATSKGLASFATGTADQYFNQAFNRAAQTFDMNRSTALSRANTLQSLAQMGLSGTNQQADAVGSTSGQQASNVFSGGQFNARMAEDAASQIGRYLTGQGDSKASGIVGSTNAITGGISNGVKAINDFLTQRKYQNSGSGISSFATPIIDGQAWGGGGYSNSDYE